MHTPLLSELLAEADEPVYLRHPGWVEVGVAWSDGEGGLLWRLAEGSRMSTSGRWWSSLGDSDRPVAVVGAGGSAAVRGDGAGDG